MAFPGVTETDLHAGTALPLQAGILALTITFQGSRHLCISLLPLPHMLHLTDWYATISSDFVFIRGRFSTLLHRI